MLKFITGAAAGAAVLLAGMLVGQLIAIHNHNVPFVPALHNPSPSPSFVLYVGEDQ